MAYKRTFGDGTMNPFNSQVWSDAGAYVQNHIPSPGDVLANLATGQMTAAQAERITDAATRDVMRAKPGIGYSEARRMVEGDIKASIALNGGTAEDWLRNKFELGHQLATATEHTLLWAGVLVVAGVGAVLLAERRR